MDSEPNSQWLTDLYASRAAELVLYGRALGLGQSEAEDVLQETFVALMRLAKPPENPAHYCIRAYRNAAANFRRGWWRRLTRELESHRWFERGNDESPAERAAMRSLAKLPVEQREVIVLKIWHEHTFEGIGELLGISPHTAAGRYRYGLQKLRLALAGQPDSPFTDEKLDLLGSPTAELEAAGAVPQA